MICQGFYQAHSRHSPVWSTAARIECNMTSAAVNDRLWFVYLGVHYQKRYSWWMVAAYRPHTEVRRSEQLMAQPQQQNRWTKLTVIQIEWIYHETKQLEIAKQTAQRFHQIPYRRYWLSISCHQQMPSQELYFWQPRTCIKAQIMHVMSSTASRQLSIHIDIVLFTPSARDNPFCWCRGAALGNFRLRTANACKSHQQNCKAERLHKAWQRLCKCVPTHTWTMALGIHTWTMALGICSWSALISET